MDFFLQTAIGQAIGMALASSLGGPLGAAVGTAYAISSALGQFVTGFTAGLGLARGPEAVVVRAVIVAAAHGAIFAMQPDFKQNTDSAANRSSRQTQLASAPFSDVQPRLPDQDDSPADWAATGAFIGGPER